MTLTQQHNELDYRPSLDFTSFYVHSFFFLLFVCACLHGSVTFYPLNLQWRYKTVLLPQRNPLTTLWIATVSLLTPGNHWSVLHLYYFITSRMSYKWNYHTCRLLRLAFSTEIQVVLCINSFFMLLSSILLQFYFVPQFI